MADGADYERVLFKAPRAVGRIQSHPNLLMAAVTMDEIRAAAKMLGLTFREAVRERERLYRARWGI